MAEKPTFIITGREEEEGDRIPTKTRESGSQSDASLCEMESPIICQCPNTKFNEEGKEATVSIKKVVFSFG